jgi:hypothetical protein
MTLGLRSGWLGGKTPTGGCTGQFGPSIFLGIDTIEATLSPGPGSQLKSAPQKAQRVGSPESPSWNAPEVVDTLIAWVCPTRLDS